ncbi:MAG: hypothetical protein A7316_05255 [Candidatus Altiarchaeales archaeon WOR_SM1_86-2]|nr:MAG: hypothetical protein A7315_04870 [Candidatus Altiarchaeales archaeon WOR_SM1_79]ODS39517.1 MAG: hypothetical protein A7316_05255 [Candidatus Altiarchaeales archaeon WOR_SM1_86-2]
MRVKNILILLLLALSASACSAELTVDLRAEKEVFEYLEVPYFYLTVNADETAWGNVYAVERISPTESRNIPLFSTKECGKLGLNCGGDGGIKGYFPKKVSGVDLTLLGRPGKYEIYTNFMGNEKNWMNITILPKQKLLLDINCMAVGDNVNCELELKNQLDEPAGSNELVVRILKGSTLENNTIMNVSLGSYESRSEKFSWQASEGVYNVTAGYTVDSWTWEDSDEVEIEMKEDIAADEIAALDEKPAENTGRDESANDENLASGDARVGDLDTDTIITLAAAIMIFASIVLVIGARK